MAIVGYMRSSTTEQKLDTQRDKLNRYGCEKIFFDQLSGMDASRPGFVSCLDYLREGDQLVFTRVDRLARSTTDLCNTAKSLEAKGVSIKALDQSFDTTTTEGKLLFGILSVIAEFETTLRAERQREGILKAQQQGVKFGRKKQLTSEVVSKIISMRQEPKTILEIMQVTGLSKASVYRALSSDRSVS